MKKCLIRVDSNSLIGTGHLMRCLEIAKELALMCHIVFASADHLSIGRVKKAGVLYINLSLAGFIQDIMISLPGGCRCPETFYLERRYRGGM